MHRECKFCEEYFTPTNQNRKYCSNECREKQRAKDVKEYKERNKDKMYSYTKSFNERNKGYQRELRKRKKDYIESLKQTIKRLSEENKTLKIEIENNSIWR